MPVATVQETTCQAIRKMILCGKLKGGQRIKEELLARELGASRQPIRESLVKLSTEGIVEKTPRIGFRVKNYTIKDLIELYELREVIEGLAARKAASVGTEKSFQNLEKLHKDLGIIIESSTSNPDLKSLQNSLDEKFHRTILDIGANGRTGQYAKLLLNEQKLCLSSTHPVRLTIGQETFESHERIINAILGRRPEDAERFMRRHISAALATMLKDYRTEENV